MTQKSLPVRPRRMQAAAAAALVGLSLVGCGRRSAPPVAPATNPLALAPVDRRALDEAIGRHRGKVVLVEFWATWCVPCVKLFPHTVELSRRNADRGLVVIAVSMDDADQRGAVRRFLQDQRAGFENFLSRYGVGSEGFDAFAITDGALPHLKLYDRDGRLRKTFTGDGRPLAPEIDAAVNELL